MISVKFARSMAIFADTGPTVPVPTGLRFRVVTGRMPRTALVMKISSAEQRSGGGANRTRTSASQSPGVPVATVGVGVHVGAGLAGRTQLSR